MSELETAKNNEKLAHQVYREAKENYHRAMVARLRLEHPHEIGDIVRDVDSNRVWLIEGCGVPHPGYYPVYYAIAFLKNGTKGTAQKKLYDYGQGNYVKVGHVNDTEEQS
jgi:hypothetical protein